MALRHIEPPIWRRLYVYGDSTFAELHQILQIAFGWQNYHMYCFDFGDLLIQEENPDLGPEVKQVPPEEALICDYLKPGDQVVYVYDFGDDWQHQLVVENVLAKGELPHVSGVPVCPDGARHRPPEEVGGVGGYLQFLEIIGDEKHPEHEDMLVWAEKDAGRAFYVSSSRFSTNSASLS